jgi:hypothetical protein
VLVKNHCAQPAARADNRDVAVEVGAPHRDIQPAHLLQQHRRGVAIVVVRTHADHANPGMHGRQEGGDRIGGAMVRDFENVRAQIGTRVEQRVLRLDLDVARKQDPGPGRRRRAQHQRGVVRIRARAVEGGGRGEDVQP